MPNGKESDIKARGKTSINSFCLNILLLSLLLIKKPLANKRQIT